MVDAVATLNDRPCLVMLRYLLPDEVCLDGLTGRFDELFVQAHARIQIQIQLW